MFCLGGGAKCFSQKEITRLYQYARTLQDPLHLRYTFFVHGSSFLVPTPPSVQRSVYGQKDKEDEHKDIYYHESSPLGHTMATWNHMLGNVGMLWLFVFSYALFWLKAAKCLANPPANDDIQRRRLRLVTEDEKIPEEECLVDGTDKYTPFTKAEVIPPHHRELVRPFVFPAALRLAIDGDIKFTKQHKGCPWLPRPEVETEDEQLQKYEEEERAAIESSMPARYVELAQKKSKKASQQVKKEEQQEKKPVTYHVQAEKGLNGTFLKRVDFLIFVSIVAHSFLYR